MLKQLAQAKKKA